MTSTAESPTRGSHLFASYAYPPNELGYCGPPDASVLLSDSAGTEIARHAEGFDGAWSYLLELAAAARATDPLDTDVVRNYWLGGELAQRVDGARLLHRLRTALGGQPTGLLTHPALSGHVTAHHCFHVFAVYPWIRFLRADADAAHNATPVRILQSCRIRWGTVQSVDDDRVTIATRPLIFDDGTLALGAEHLETVGWAKDDVALAPRPSPGQTVSAHWDWVCGILSERERDALAAATTSTLNLVNQLAFER